MDSREFTEWIGYDRYDPIGSERMDLGFAVVAAMIYNVNRGKNDPQKSPNDFLPEFYKGKAALLEERAKRAQSFVAQYQEGRKD